MHHKIKHGTYLYTLDIILDTRCLTQDTWHKALDAWQLDTINLTKDASHKMLDKTRHGKFHYTLYIIHRYKMLATRLLTKDTWHKMFHKTRHGKCHYTLHFRHYTWHKTLGPRPLTQDKTWDIPLYIRDYTRYKMLDTRLLTQDTWHKTLHTICFTRQDMGHATIH